MFSSAVYRFAGNLLAPAGSRARLSILIFHRVLATDDPILPGTPSASHFDRQIGILSRVFNILPLADAVARLKAGTLPARSACITFDDGYADNYTHALPILQKHGIPATFFIATAYLDGGRMFNDTVIEAVRRAPAEQINLTALGLGVHDVSSPEAKVRAIGWILPRVKYLPLGERENTVAELARTITGAALPDDLMLTARQLVGLHEAGMEIGSHTHRHPILAKLDHAAARAEIATGKERLEALLGERVRLFAYPNGKPGVDYRPDQAGLLRDLGFEAAVSTHYGVGTADSDFYQLPRFTPWSPHLAWFIPHLLNNLRVAPAGTAFTPALPLPADAPETR